MILLQSIRKGWKNPQHPSLQERENNVTKKSTSWKRKLFASFKWSRRDVVDNKSNIKSRFNVTWDCDDEHSSKISGQASNIDSSDLVNKRDLYSNFNDDDSSVADSQGFFEVSSNIVQSPVIAGSNRSIISKWSIDEYGHDIHTSSNHSNARLWLISDLSIVSKLPDHPLSNCKHSAAQQPDMKMQSSDMYITSQSSLELSTGFEINPIPKGEHTDDKSADGISIWSYNTFGRTEEAKLDEYLNNENNDPIQNVRSLRYLLLEMDELPGALPDDFEGTINDSTHHDNKFLFQSFGNSSKYLDLAFGDSCEPISSPFFPNKKEDLATTPPIKRKGKSHLSHRELETVTSKEIQQRIRTLLNNDSILK